MRSGSTRREFLGAVATAPAVGALSGRTTGESAPPVGAIQTGEEWPEFGFDSANTGYNPDGTGPISDIGGRWTAQATGRLTAQPAVADGVVYVASQDGRVYAFDAENGDPREGWPVELDGPTGSPPAVVDGTLYVGDDTGTVHAIDAASGETEWRFGTAGSAETAPTVVDGIVYASSTDAVYAIDPDGATSGVAEQWSYELGEDDNRTITTAPAVATVETDSGTERIVYVGLDSSAGQNGAIFAINGGDQEWAVEAQGPILAAPTVSDGWLYVAGGLEGSPKDGLLYKLDAATGSAQGGPLSTPGWIVGSPAVTGDTIYVGTRRGELMSIDIESGDLNWSFNASIQISSSPAVVDGTVYLTTESSFAYAIDPGGDQVWSYQTNGSQFGSPAVANGTVYVPSVGSTEESTLYALGEGGEIESGATVGDTDSGNVSGSVIESTGPESDFAFLAVPAAVGGFFTLVAAVGYAIIRSGVTKQFEVDEAPVEKLYDDEDEIPGTGGRSQSAVWSAVVGDVIKRADGSEKAATADIIVSKYVDSDTLDSPVVAYEIESARDGPAQVTISEPFVDEALADELDEQPLNEGWSVGEDGLRFETTVGAGETIKTMVGRQDCPIDRAEELFAKPPVSVEPFEG